MGIVTTKSTVVGNRDASPAVINDGRLERGSLRSSVGSVLVGAADSATSFYPLCPVPSTAIIRDILATAVAGMTTFAVNIGVFLNTKASGGVALGTPAFTGSGTYFASAFSMATAQARVSVVNQSGTNVLTKKEQPLWQAIGMAADPGGTLDIGMICSTANTGAAGLAGLEVTYVDNGS